MALGNHLTISPASKATKKVMEQRTEERTSLDGHHATASSSSVAQMPVKDVNAAMRDPAQRWTTANRIG